MCPYERSTRWSTASTWAALRRGDFVSPLFLLGKSRKHFVTVGYTDANGRQQALVLQVGKGDVRARMAEMEAKTGRRVEYTDDEARKGRG